MRNENQSGPQFFPRETLRDVDLAFYAAMPKAKAMTAMKRLRMSPAEREEIWAAVRDHKNAMRTQGARTLRAKKEWADIIRALHEERQRVRVALTYKPRRGDDTARREAFEAYNHVLTHLWEEVLKPLSASGIRPCEHALTKSRPNSGDHWTDWIPAKVRARVEALFHAIPKGVRIKYPFERIIPEEQHEERKARLRKRCETDREMILSLLNVRPADPKLRTQLQHAARALTILDAVTPDTPLPKVWRDLIDPEGPWLKMGRWGYDAPANPDAERFLSGIMEGGQTPSQQPGEGDDTQEPSPSHETTSVNSPQ